MQYHYMIHMGKATLSKMLDNGNDVDQKPKLIGKFKTDIEAKDACIKHHQKACKMAKAKGIEEPKILFV